MSANAIDVILRTGYSQSAFFNLYPIGGVGSVTATRIIGHINQALKSFSQISNDKARSDFEKSEFSSKLLKSYSTSVNQAIESWKPLIEARNETFAAHKQSALTGGQDVNFSFLLAKELRSEPHGKKQLELLNSDRRFIYAANAVPSAVSGIAREALEGANARYLEREHPNLLDEENKIAVELNALRDLHHTAMSIANHIKLHTDKPCMNTAADESLLNFG